MELINPLIMSFCLSCSGSSNLQKLLLYSVRKEHGNSWVAYYSNCYICDYCHANCNYRDFSDKAKAALGIDSNASVRWMIDGNN